MTTANSKLQMLKVKVEIACDAADFKKISETLRGALVWLSQRLTQQGSGLPNMHLIET